MAYSSNDSSRQQPSPSARKLKDDAAEGILFVLQRAKMSLKKGVCLSLTYDGHNRVVEVHTLGMGRGQGKACISAYQVDGDSPLTKPEGWLLMYLDQCFDVELTNRRSGAPRRGYTKGCKGFMRIDAEV